MANKKKSTKKKVIKKKVPVKKKKVIKKKSVAKKVEPKKVEPKKVEPKKVEPTMPPLVSQPETEIPTPNEGENSKRSNIYGTIKVILIGVFLALGIILELSYI